MDSCFVYYRITLGATTPPAPSDSADSDSAGSGNVLQTAPSSLRLQLETPVFVTFGYLQSKVLTPCLFSPISGGVLINCIFITQMCNVRSETINHSLTDPLTEVGAITYKMKKCHVTRPPNVFLYGNANRQEVSSV